MHLIHVLLPLADNEGRPLPRTLLRAVAGEFAETFSGLTAHTRATAEGLWRDGSSGTDTDDIVIYEVIAEELDEGRRKEYWGWLEGRFRPEKVVVRAQVIRVL